METENSWGSHHIINHAGSFTGVRIGPKGEYPALAAFFDAMNSKTDRERCIEASENGKDNIHRYVSSPTWVHPHSSGGINRVPREFRHD